MKHQYHTRAAPDDFLRAFSNESLLTDSERMQLRLHYHQPDHAATFIHLGTLMGENCHQGVSRRNVCMAQKITRFLGVDPPRREDGSPQWWTFLVYAEKAGRYWRIQLRPEVVSALARVDWIQDLSLPELVLHAELKEQVARAYADPPKKRRARLAKAPKRPSVVQVTRTEFRRNGDVVVEVMLRADGVCEACGSRAPFVRISDGMPYLEIHHILPLASGGDDTVENAAALCPNCHRRAHYAGDARAFTALLKRRVADTELGGRHDKWRG
jgi:5-methylcytosine-specific restriction endonuclease McrA